MELLSHSTLPPFSAFPKLKSGKSKLRLKHQLTPIDECVEMEKLKYAHSIDQCHKVRFNVSSLVSNNGSQTYEIVALFQHYGNLFHTSKQHTH
jgi:hypothetical protein